MKKRILALGIAITMALAPSVSLAEEPLRVKNEGILHTDLKKGLSITTMLWEKFMKPLSYDTTLSYEKQEGVGFIGMDKVVLEEGMFKESQELGLEYILDMDVDRMLAPSFEMASLPTPNGAIRYEGWEKKGASNWGWSADTFTLAGHTIGHWMSAASVMYAATGNEEIKEKLDYAIGQFAFIQNETNSGYIGGCDEDTFIKCFNGENKWYEGYWVPWYGVHKIYQGLIDAYEFTGNEKALAVCVKFADWAMAGLNRMSDEQVQKMMDIEYGGMNDVFAQLYEIIGKEEYLITARRFTHDKILNPLGKCEDNLTGLHANTQIPKIIGTAEIFEQDNEKYQHYGKASKYFWDTVVNNRSFVIGGNSVSEHFEDKGLESLHHKTSESCNTYNMLKLTEHLFKWEQKSEYMDYYENALYNHILGTQDPITGNKMYFVSLLQGHYRIYGTKYDSFWCCTGTGMENPGRYTKCIYYKDGEELFVNLYIASTVKWEEKNLTITQETNYPYEDKVFIKIAEGQADATLKFRVPSWAKKAVTASFNGKTFTKTEAGYLEVEGSFKKGDIIELTIPMELELYKSRKEGQVAFKYGPVVLAAALGNENFPQDTVKSEVDLGTQTTKVPFILYEGEDVTELVQMVERETLTFKLNGKYLSEDEDVTLMPFYEIHHQFHSVYFNMNMEGDMFVKNLNNVTIDYVQPDGQQDELGHSFEGKATHNGAFSANCQNYMWRDAWGEEDAFISYVMKVDNKNKNYLCVTYWGTDHDFVSGDTRYEREFSIFVDGEKVGAEHLQHANPGKAHYCYYEIPEALVKGKEIVTVKFAPDGIDKCAGGVLEVRVVSEIVEE